MKSPSVSLILATYGRTDDIGRLVDSLIAQTDQRFELIFVDQNLDERVAPYVAKARVSGIEVKHLRQDKPNLSKARNAGIAVAQGLWVAFPDDDCWYEPDTIEVILATPAEDVDGWVMSWVEHDLVVNSLADQARFDLKKWRQFRGGDASSITLVFRLGLVQHLGGFDERLGVGQWFGAAEETDFFLRTLSTGSAVKRLALARVHHRFGVGSEKRLKKGAWRSALYRARGTGAVYAKHRLPWFVVARGFIAPVFNKLIVSRELVGFSVALATSFGRLQGWWSWRK